MDKAYRAAVIVVGLIGSASLWGNPQQTDRQLSIDTLQTVVSLLDQTYVDPIPAQAIFQSAMKGIFSSLDPYSEYMSQDEYQQLLKEQKGVYAGVGIDLVTKDQFHVVVTPLFGSPAELSGVRAGDRLIRVNGTSVLGLPLDSAVRMIRGLPGTPVKLTFLRDGSEIDFVLYRGLVKENPVRDECLLPGRIGYMKIIHFRPGVVEQVREALVRFIAQDVQGLIIDLRNNPGGVLEDAVQIAAMFLKQNKVIVRVKGRDEQSEKKYRVQEAPLAPTVPLCVLINEGSASAAEVIAGSFHDHNRATVIGQKSFGKGSVQTLVPLPQGGAVRFTTHRYILPNGGYVEGQGVIPDLVVATPELENTFRLDLRQLRKSHEQLIEITSDQIVDPQVLAALEDLMP